MMQKVGNRSLLVTTDVPGHHRPILTKQLKCQSLHCGTAAAAWNCLGGRHAGTDFGCGKAARLQPPLGAKTAWRRPRLSPITQHSQPVSRLRLKPRHWPAIFTNKARRSRNLGDSSSVSQPTVASQGAKSEMPTIYTPDDFVLIRLHERRARTISDSVTSRKRVGRSISGSASTQGETIMNSSLNHGSATIYQFPAGGRAALGGRRYDETKPAAEPAAPSRVNEAASSGSWYHEAAIQESKPAWER
jgi:uncharacterized protein DUF2735